MFADHNINFGKVADSVFYLFQVGCDGEQDKILFIWPTTIVHKIEKGSPLYHMSATDLLRERFEIIVVLGNE